MKLPTIKRLALLLALTMAIAHFMVQQVWAADNTSKEEYVLLTDSRVRIASKYDGRKDIWIDFNKAGPNSVMGLGGIYLADNRNKKVSSYLNRKAELFMQSCSDWIGPYWVKSNKCQDTFLCDFTGGWHGTSINNSVRPTARMVSFGVVADGRELKQNKVTGANFVDINVISQVQGYNTVNLEGNSGEILKETVHYFIRGGKVDVSVEIEALEDITILRYYGLQTQNYSWQGKVYYENGANIPEGFDTCRYSASGKKRDFPNVNRIIIKSENGEDKLEAWMDRAYGIGNMELVEEYLPCAFTVSYGKSYFNLINGREKILLKGQKLHWRGGYVFGKC